MTITVSQKQESTQTPVSSSSKLKSKRKTWAEEKIDLVNKRLRALPQMANNEEPQNEDKLSFDKGANNVREEPQKVDKRINNMSANDVPDEIPNADKLMSNMCDNDVPNEPPNADKLLNMCANNVPDELPNAAKLMSIVCANNVQAENIIVPYIHTQSEVKTTSQPHSSGGVLASATDRAKRVQANLSKPDYSCLKNMLPSHVAGGFWLGLPKKFCTSHMPKMDSKVVLVDENGIGYDTKYLVKKNGLSGGWRGFSIAHGLVQNDVVIFELLESCKLKVYIIRANPITEVDGAIGLMDLASGPKPMVTENQLEESAALCLEKEDENYSDLLLALENQEDSDVNSGSGGSEVHEGVRFTETILLFEDVKKFEDFGIHVDGDLVIDSQFPAHVIRMYYELCCSQNMFLHSHFIKGLNIKVVAGAIFETVNIAQAIKHAKPTTSVKDLESWEKTLKAFEDLGMAVGFLRARINKLLNLTRDSQAAIESKRRERAEAERERRCLMDKLHDVGAMVKRLDVELDALLVKDKDRDSLFTEVAGASW